MARRSRADVRKVIPDPIYGEMLITQITNKILMGGKKTLARNTVYEALEIVGKKTKEEPVEVLKKAVKNVRPSLEVKPRRVGGATYQVPVEVPKKRSTTLAIRWIVDYARDRRKTTFAQALADELVDASKVAGNSIKKKQDIHKMAEANRAFAHYRW